MSVVRSKEELRMLLVLAARQHREQCMAEELEAYGFVSAASQRVFAKAYNESLRNANEYVEELAVQDLLEAL